MGRSNKDRHSQYHDGIRNKGDRNVNRGDRYNIRQTLADLTEALQNEDLEDDEVVDEVDYLDTMPYAKKIGSAKRRWQ